MRQFIKSKLQKGNIMVGLILLIGVAAMLIAGVIPSLVGLGQGTSIEKSLNYLGSQGYYAYADPQGILHADGLVLTEALPLTLEGNAKVWKEYNADLNPAKLAVNAKPTVVNQGIFVGYSLPVGGADEELFFDMNIPKSWDEESDIHCHVYAWLDTAQNEAADAAKLQLDWEHMVIGHFIPATSNTVTTEVVSGVVNQYKCLPFEFTIDYDIDPAHLIEHGDIITLHITRIASSHEITGEVVIHNVGVLFQCDSLGSANPD